MISSIKIFVFLFFLFLIFSMIGISQPVSDNFKIKFDSYNYASSDSASKVIQDGRTNDSIFQEDRPEGIERIVLNLPQDWSLWGEKIFDENNIPLVLGLSALTFASIKTDHQTWEQLHNLYYRDHSFKNIVETSVFVGDGKFQFGIAAGFAAYGFIFNDSKALKTAEQTAEVILACGAVVQLLKHVTGRERPEAATAKTGKWDFFPNQVKYHKKIPSFDAFPSGHLATAAATLIVIIENYPEQNWIKYAGYPILGFVSVGLAAKGMHWLSDFPLALALGYSFGKVIASKNKNKPNNINESFDYIPKINIALLNNRSPGINLSWKL
jgi:membrane-associated phospholipid phosphatase